MAQPGHNQYDDDNSPEPIIRPDLRRLEGGGQTTPRSSEHLQGAPDNESTEGDSNSSAPTSARERANQAWGMSPEELQEAEESDTEEDLESSLENDEGGETKSFYKADKDK